jgi:hypothetical protein
LNGSGYKSLWAKEEICLFVKNNSVLTQLGIDLSTETSLMSGLNLSEGLDYTQGGGFIFFSNMNVIGYVKNGSASLFPSVTQTFKKPMVSGSLIDYFNSRLYALRDNRVYYSDAAAPMVTDKRKNFFQINGKGSLLLSVRDGIYVGTEKGAWFYFGRDPGEFQRIQVSDGEVFGGSGVKMSGDDLSETGIGTYVRWASPKGLFVGGPGGEVKNVTWGKFVIKEVPRSSGAAFVCSVNNSQQYLFNFSFDGSLDTNVEVPQIEIRSNF